MERFRKIWDAGKNEWLVAHKDMPRRERYGAFLAAFPEADDVTETAFYNKCSRMGAVHSHATHGSTVCRPLYSEQVKKGYVRIKVAQPNVWVSKAKWVYMETHPWEDFAERSNYVFLDGDSRNFDPSNIERVPLRVMAQFNLSGGCERGKPEITRLRIMLAKLKMARFDAGEMLGLVVSSGKTRNRMFIEERNRKAREYAARKRELLAARSREYYRRLKETDPEKFARRAERHKEYCRERYRRKKEK